MFDCICVDACNDEQIYCISEIWHYYGDEDAMPECIECKNKIDFEEKVEITITRNFEDIAPTEIVTCLTCKAIRDDLFSCGFYYGNMWESLKQQWGEDAYLLR